MTGEEIAVWATIIFCSDLAAGSIFEVYHYLKNKKKKFDIDCDACHKVVALSRTPDKSGYLCKTCMEIFLLEHQTEFSEEQIAKARKGYRRIKRSKSKNK